MLFRSTNLKNFVFRVSKFESLPHFTFPNLTTLDFEIWTSTYPVSELLDCLETSPALRWIRIMIEADQLHEDVPPGRVAVLLCAKTFVLHMTNYGPGCEIATHISCPFAEDVEFDHRPTGDGDNVGHLPYIDCMERDCSSVYKRDRRASRARNDDIQRRRHRLFGHFQVI